MKENYWVREELDNESFRHELKQQDKRHSISHHQEHGQNNGQKHNRHKQNRAKSTATAPTTNTNTNITAREYSSNNNNKSNNNLDGHSDRLIQSNNGSSSSSGENDEADTTIQGDKIDLGRKFTADEPAAPGEEFGRNDTSVSVPLEYKEGLQIRGQQQPIKRDENEVNLSFCGCGFLGIYHVGVASCFHQYAPQLSMHKIAGSSAGALVAVAHICGNLTLAYCTTDILRVAIDARARALGPFHPSFDINATVREALERGLPDDVHLRASGKLHISLTRVYDGENVVVSEFESKEDVIQALLCSCFIPFWSGLVTPKYKGVSYMDGGFSKNLLILDNKTVTVSPFAGETDICPQDDGLNLLQISISSTSFSLSPNNLYRLSHALLPPPPEVLSDLCEQGFADGIRFLQRMKLISCTKCLEIRSSLLVTVNGNDMEEAFTQQANTDESMKSTSSFSENHHIRLEQKEQKMIEINDGSSNSVVSTTSQIYHHQPTKLTIPYQNDELENNLENPSEMMENDDCNECYLMRQKALCEPLPTQFSDRIRDACDAVNKSLSNWFYSYRPIKYLSYLAAPYYLPIDISLALILKCWQELPSIRSELLDCVSNIVRLLIQTLRRVHLRGSTSRSLMLGPVSSLEQEKEAREEARRAIKNEKEPIRVQKKSVYATENITKVDEDDNNNENHSTNDGDISCCLLNACSCQQNNCTISVETTTTTTTTAPETVESSLSSKIKPDGLCISGPKTPQASSNSHAHHNHNHNLHHHNHHHNQHHQQQLHSLEDTFDSIVDVTSNQEARIFAYYFRDAKNRLQVTEIFDLERAAELSHSTTGSCCSLSSNNNKRANGGTTTS